MSQFSELIAEANNTVSGSSSEPSATDFYTSKLREGVASGVGNVLDAPARAYQLLKAGVGVSPAGLLAQKAFGSAAMPEVNLKAANFFTDTIKEALGVATPTKTADSTRKVLGGIVEGAGAGVTSPAKGALTAVGQSGLLSSLAGGGAEVAGEATGDNPYARLAGAILAGVGAPALVQGRMEGVRALRGGADDAVSRARQNAAPMVERMVNKQLEQSVAGAPNAVDDITTALVLRQQMPGFNPSVAEMSGAPGAADMQRRYALLSPQNLNAEVAKDRSNVDAIRQFYERVAPQSGRTANVRDEINRGLASQQQAATTQAQGVARRLQEADQMAVGSRLGEIADVERTAARGPIQQAYQSAFDVAPTATTSSTRIVEEAENILGQRLSEIKPETAPRTIAAIQRIFGDKSKELTGRSIPPDLMEVAGMSGTKELTLRDLHDLRVAVGQDVASAQRSMDPAAATRLRNMARLYNPIDEAIGNLPKAQADAYSNALNKYRTEYAPRFKEGTNLQVFMDKSTNEPRILPDRFVAEYFKTDAQGGVTRAGQFSQLFGSNQEARDLARQGIQDIYRQKVVNPTTGTINIDAHNAFLRDYGRTLRAFGGDTLRDLDSIGAAAVKAMNAGERIQELTKVLKYDTVDQLADAALRDQKVMGNALYRLGAEGRETFARMLMDRAVESGTAKGLSDFLNNNQRTLKMALPQGQIDNLRDIAKALEITERAPIRGALTTGGPDLLKNATGVSLATVWAQMRATTGGRQGAATMAFNLAAPVMTRLSQTEFDGVMRQALHDPKTAENLRNFLLANNPEQANLASRALLAARRSGEVLWSMKGPVLKYAIGTPNYVPNIARTGAELSNVAQDINY